VERRCLLVGHNMILDICYLFSHFGEELPNSLKEFKTLLRISFEGIVDTKFLFEKFSEQLKIDPLEKSNLENVYLLLKTQLNNKVKISIPENFKDYSKEASYHDAGFDAFVTGNCFIFLKEFVGDKLLEHKNKINMMKSVYSCFDLQGDEPLLYPNTKTYCLKGKNTRNDIDLKKILNESFQNKIVRINSTDYSNSIIIFVELQSMEMIIDFEKQLKTNYFDVYNVQKFKEIMVYDKKKKY